MSKRTYIARYSLLLRKLKHKAYPTWPEIHTYVQRELEMLRLQDESIKPNFSKRTFDRDKADLRETFGISIEHSSSERGYYIEDDAYQSQSFERVMEAFDMFNALRLSQDVSRFIHLEQRRPTGTEHLYGLLHSIKNRLEVKFNYSKYWEEHTSHRQVASYGLKEYRNRWYLVARDFKDDLVKTFGLDRISNLQILSKTFPEDPAFDVNEYFRYSFGVIELETEPEEVELSFTPFQGKYIKSLPLHSTQEVLIDNAQECRVKLRVYPTYDLKMELLSFGDQVTVLAPKSLKKEILQEHQKAAEKQEEP